MKLNYRTTPRKIHPQIGISRRLVIRIILILCTLSFNIIAYGADLLDVYNDALNNDPVFKAAYTTLLSQKELFPQARAGLQPSILGTGSTTRVRRTSGVVNFGSLEPKVVYYQHDYSISLTQPIFNYANWMQLRSASATVKQAQATYNAAAQDLIIRVAKAYFNVLQAEDTLRFTEAEKRANARQLDQAQQRYKVGLDAITSVYEARASYDAVVAREIAAKNDVVNTRETLRQITGKFYPKLSAVRGQLPLVRPKPNDVEAWVTTATRQNYQLLASRFAAQAARENIKVQAGANYPTLDMVAQYEDSNNTRPLISRTDARIASLGVQLNFPMFQGGLTLSKTRQAKYDYQTANWTADSTFRSTTATTRQTYNSVIAGISKIKADRQAILSQQSSLESTEAAFKVGTRTIVDVLDAQRDLFDSQRTTSVDQYTYINDTLLLKQAAGTLSGTDLIEINSWLETNKHYPQKPKASIPNPYPQHTKKMKQHPPISSRKNHPHKTKQALVQTKKHHR